MTWQRDGPPRHVVPMAEAAVMLELALLTMGTPVGLGPPDPVCRPSRKARVIQGWE